MAFATLVTYIMDVGRWDRTHEALGQAALELFAEQGYDATGTAQVAERAGVSEMTLFRHYPSKEALLLADPFDPLMADAVRARPAGESPMRALAEGIGGALAEVDSGTAHALRARLRMVAAASSLQGAVERSSGATIAALVGALAERGVVTVEAQVAATAMISGLSVALLDWAQSDEAPLDGALGRALDVLGGA